MKWVASGFFAGIALLLLASYVDLKREEAKWDRRWARVQKGEVLHLPRFRLK